MIHSPKQLRSLNKLRKKGLLLVFLNIFLNFLPCGHAQTNEQEKKFLNEIGIIGNSENAIQLGKLYLSFLFGGELVENYEPYHAKMNDDRSWEVTGTLNCKRSRAKEKYPELISEEDCIGAIPYVNFDKLGRVIKIMLR